MVGIRYRISADGEVFWIQINIDEGWAPVSKCRGPAYGGNYGTAREAVDRAWFDTGDAIWRELTLTGGAKMSKKYQIVTNGELFKVQVRVWAVWPFRRKWVDFYSVLLKRDEAKNLKCLYRSIPCGTYRGVREAMDFVETIDPKCQNWRKLTVEELNRVE